MNAATHAVGLVFSLAGATVVTAAAVRDGSAWEVWGCAIYAATMVAAYAASMLSHLFHQPRVRHALRVADQAIIYLFIVGTFTPVALTWLRDGPWWILHGAMWTVALTGFISKVVFNHNVRQGTVSAALYLLLGWMPIVTIWPLAHALPGGLTLSIVGGGLWYTFGIVFFIYDERIRYFHAAWHTMVIAGSATHYLGILLYCTNPPG